MSEKALCQGERLQTLVINRHSSGHQEHNQLQGAWPLKQCLGLDPVVIEDLLDAGAFENCLQDCAEPEIFCETVSFSSLAMNKSPLPSKPVAWTRQERLGQILRREGSRKTSWKK